MPTLADAITALRAELAEVEDQYAHDPRFGWDEVTLRVGAQVTDKREASLGLEIFGLSGKGGGARQAEDSMELTITFRRLTADDGAAHAFTGIAGEVTDKDGADLDLFPRQD